MSDKTEHPPLPQAFADLGVRNSVLRGLAAASFKEPSPIQSMLIPPALGGGDLLGQARTGTGKTGAFGIPILCRATPGIPAQALILVPTRELAIQVDEELRRLGKFTPLRYATIVGGQKIAGQLKMLSHDPEIIIGTPGRVMDLMERGQLRFDNMRFMVLDEVDRMLDIGFREDVRRILAQVKEMRSRRANPDAPSEPMQTIFVSATISNEIEGLARKYMRDPQKLVASGEGEPLTVDKIEQAVYVVNQSDKYRLLRKLFDQEEPQLSIVFTRTKHGAEKLAKHLRADGIDCHEIHGNLKQNRRDSVMKGFKGGKFEVLVATDLASRGIDVANISHIVNYDVPEDPEVYVHRIGRTARMGASGKAYTFVCPDQGHEMTRIERLINQEIPHAKMDGIEAKIGEGGGGSSRGGRGGRGGRAGGAPRPITPLNAARPMQPLGGQRQSAPATSNAPAAPRNDHPLKKPGGMGGWMKRKKRR